MKKFLQNIPSPVWTIIGVMLGALITPLTTSYFTYDVQRTALIEKKRVQAVSEIYSAVTEENNPFFDFKEAMLQLSRTSKVMMYSSSEAISKQAMIFREHPNCGKTLEVMECLDSEVRVINITRKDIGLKPVPENDLRVLLEPKFQNLQTVIDNHRNQKDFINLFKPINQ